MTRKWPLSDNKYIIKLLKNLRIFEHKTILIIVSIVVIFINKKITKIKTSFLFFYSKIY